MAATAEGGVIDEEFRLSYVFDRLETTATAFLGLTIGCAQCHDHKFDPVSQREYYQMAAFFNQVRELGMTGDDGEFGPLLSLHNPESRDTLSRLDVELKESSAQLEQIREEAFNEYRQSIGKAQEAGALTLPSSGVSSYPLDQVAECEKENKKAFTLDGNENSTASIRPTFVAGVVDKAVHLNGEFGFLEIKGEGLIEVADQLSTAIWICPDPDDRAPDARQCRVLLGTAGDKNRFWRGWEFFLDPQGHLAVWIIHCRPDNLVHVRSIEPIEDGKWTHVAFTYDGTGKAKGVKLFADGQQVESEILYDRLDRSIYPRLAAPGYPIDKERAIRVGRSYRGFTGDFGIYRGTIDDIRLFESCLTSLEVASLNNEYSIASNSPKENLSEQDRFDHWLRRSHKPWQEADQRHRELLAERVKVLSEVPQIMVMEDMTEPRTTYVLDRGDYTQPREKVTASTPQAVLPLSSHFPANRLGLAEWIFDPANPLTARVAVNRYWQLMFGQGLIQTTHDFGVQGQRPTHPELLDWLAVEFRESGWDVRALLRLIANSATYRQSSNMSVSRDDSRLGSKTGSGDPRVVDPNNSLFWRGATYRHPGEMLRDAALASSGLLVQKVGGPSVKPYQPPGLWAEKNNFSQELLEYKPDLEDGLYRRSLYTFIRRTSPPPAMTTFDAPDRSVCTVKRETTNTPMQALVLFNDPQFVEAARVLSQSVLTQVEGSEDTHIKEVFVRLLGREPTTSELRDLHVLFEGALDRYQSDPESAKSFLSVGESTLPDRIDEANAAALSLVANTLMSFDEFYMKR